MPVGIVRGKLSGQCLRWPHCPGQAFWTMPKVSIVRSKLSGQCLRRALSGASFPDNAGGHCPGQAFRCPRWALSGASFPDNATMPKVGIVRGKLSGQCLRWVLSGASFPDKPQGMPKVGHCLGQAFRTMPKVGIVQGKLSGQCLSWAKLG